MTREEIAILARDINQDKVFTDRHIPDNQINLLGSIFMPFILMDDDARDKLKKAEPAMFYEYMDKAGPRSINGFPCFFSVQFLNMEDTVAVWKKVKEFKEAEKKILASP